MIRILAASACLAATATGANAQLTTDSVMPSFNFQFVEPTLQAAGVTYQRVDLSETVSALDMTINGVTFRAAPAACQNAMCAGFLMQKTFEKVLTPDQLNTLNVRGRIVKIARPKGLSESIAIRYLIGDHGYTRGSFLVNLVVFANAIKQLESDIASGLGAQVNTETAGETLASVPVAPGVKILGDDFADGLNARQKSVLISGEAAGIAATTLAEPGAHEQLVIELFMSGEHNAAIFNNVD